MSKIFSPDQRNMGGRRIILQQMLQHLHHVESAKSTISKGQQVQAMKRTPSPMYRFLDQYKEVLNTFEKVQKISQKRPSVDKFKNNYFLKKVNVSNQEHQKNLEKCKKRIQEMNGKPDKKNHFNHTVYPSLFFRRIDKTLINKTCPQVVIQSRKQLNRPDVSVDIDWESVAKQVPRMQDLKEFKQRIADIIVKHRIYSDDDHAFLVCLISSVNINIEQAKIIDVVSQTLNELM